MVTTKSGLVTGRKFARTAAALSGLLLACQSGMAGTWTKVVNNPPGGIQLMLQLSDGTVMCSNQNGSTIGSAWYKLTPNAAGSYINGTWSTLAPMPHTRLYFQTQVLKDGRVYCSGGEYGTGGPFAEVYNPLTNAWTDVTCTNAALWSTAADDFYDGNSEILPDGSVLLMPVFPHTSGRAIKYNPATNVWSSGGQLFRGSYQDEASWGKLPDNTILTIDPFGTLTERYNPPTNTWINDGTVPVSLYDPFGFELGGTALLPNGKMLFLGSTGNTALYTPTGTTSPGTWAAGPVIPGSHGTPDAPCCMMVNGKVLCAVSPVPTSANHFPTPTTFYEYDYTTNSFALVSPPVGSNDPIPCYQGSMLNLPDGTVLYSHMGTSVYVYTPTGSPLAMGKPVINSITMNGDGTFHLTGTGLNGISEGAVYGDDLQMNTNYPLVRLNHSNGNKYFARTFNWSSTSVMTGAAVLTTEYKLPAGLPAGSYTVTAIGNGFSSDPAGPPSITVQPADVTTCYSFAPTTLTVTAGGVGPFTYQWRRGVTNLVNGGNISGATTNTLTFTPVSPSDAATNYNCVVSNVLGSVTSANAVLKVCYADYNCDGFLDPLDYNAFINDFEGGNLNADYNNDGFLDPLDYNAFINDFEAGC